MYVHESANVRSSLSHPISELLSVTVQSSVELFLFAVLYQPPGTDFDLSQLDQALLSLQLSNIAHAMVVGDFNVDMSEPHSAGAMNLLSVCAEYGLVQCVTESTRVVGSCESFLDLVLCT